jgi:hypothetical protein
METSTAFFRAAVTGTSMLTKMGTGSSETTLKTPC